MTSNIKFDNLLLIIYRVSHYPKDLKLGRTVGLGMNAYELSKNVQLTETVAKDLNIDPTFPFDDNSFD